MLVEIPAFASVLESSYQLGMIVFMFLIGARLLYDIETNNELEDAPSWPAWIIAATGLSILSALVLIGVRFGLGF